MAIGNRDVIIRQIFETRAPAFQEPRLVPIIIGILKQKLRKELVGVYDGGGAGNDDTLVPFPSSLIASAEVIDDTVRVFIDSRIRGLVELEDTDFEVTTQGVTIFPDAEVVIAMVDNGGGSDATLYKDGSDYILEDPGANFIASDIYGDAVNGDDATIFGFDGSSHNVIEVASKTKIKIDVTGDILTAFNARPDRVFTNITYDIDRTVTIGPDSNGLFNSGDVYLSLDAIRHDKDGEVQYIRNANDLTELGTPSVDNEVAWAAYTLNQSRDAKTGYVTVGSHTNAEHVAAIDLIDKEELYYVVPMTDDKSIVDLYVGHVNTASEPENKKERRAYVSRELPDYVDRLIDFTGELTKTGTTFKVYDELANFQDIGAQSGDVLRITSNSGSQEIIPDYTIKNVLSNEEVEIFGSVQDKVAEGADGATARDSSVLSTGAPLAAAAALPENAAGDLKLVIIDGDNAGTYSIAVSGVNDVAGTITVTDAPAGGFRSNASLEFYVYREADAIDSGDTIVYSVRSADMDAQEKSNYYRGLGESFGDRRVCLVFTGPWNFPHEDLDDDGNVISEDVNVPGHYGAAAIAAMRYSRAPQVPMSGETVRHANTIFGTSQFSDTQLTNMQLGGVLVVQPDPLTGAPFIRQLLTTDVSDKAKQEVTINESVDYFAKYIRDNIRPLMGNQNLTQQTINVVRTRLEALLEQATDENDADGPMFSPDSRLTELVISPECPDTLLAKFDLVPLFPFNRLEVDLFI